MGGTNMKKLFVHQLYDLQAIRIIYGFSKFAELNNKEIQKISKNQKGRYINLLNKGLKHHIFLFAQVEALWSIFSLSPNRYFPRKPDNKQRRFPSNEVTISFPLYLLITACPNEETDFDLRERLQALGIQQVNIQPLSFYLYKRMVCNNLEDLKKEKLENQLAAWIFFQIRKPEIVPFITEPKRLFNKKTFWRTKNLGNPVFAGLLKGDIEGFGVYLYKNKYEKKEQFVNNLERNTIIRGRPVDTNFYHSVAPIWVYFTRTIFVNDSITVDKMVVEMR